MRILFTAQAGVGHWRPLAPLAQALQAAGHKVAVAATPIFCKLIGEHGFRCFRVGLDEGTVAGEFRPDLSPAEQVYRQVFLPRSARQLSELVGLARRWRADLIVREQSQFAGALAAELLDIPQLTVQVSAYRPQLDQAFSAVLDQLRSEHGLAPDPELARLYGALFLLPFPPELLEPGTPLPASARFIQHVPFDLEHPGDDLIPSWVSRLPARRTVFATLGTAYNRTPGILSAILTGLRDEPVNLIVTTNDQDPAAFGPQPANLHLVRYLPQSLAFPFCDLVVSHGGSGTVRTALSFGLPLVILPLAADQPENARRCEALGVARGVTGENQTAAGVRAASQSVLADSGYRQRAQQLQRAFQALSELTTVVQWIEQV